MADGTDTSGEQGKEALPLEMQKLPACLLYTSDAADDPSKV